MAKTRGSFSVSLRLREAKNVGASSKMVVEELCDLPVLRTGPGLPASDRSPGTGGLQNSVHPAWPPA